MSNAPRTGPLGVLLVHGIGEQQVGDTLLGFTEPLQTFCEEWVEGASEEGGYARVTHTRLRRVTGDDGAPSHTRLRAGLRRPGSEDGDGEMEWLIAESHWAERFPVPSFRQMFAWLFSVVAPIIVRHVDSRLLLPTTVKNFDRITRLVADQEVAHEAEWRREASGARLLVTLYKGGSKLALALLARVQNVVSVALAGAILAFLALLLPLACFPRTRRAVVSVQSKLASSLGDSYVLLRSPLRADAMVAQIERDIEWLEDQGRKRIVVVAHSQGAEVARRALCRRKGGRATIDLFVTFGAGIEKLDAVRQLAERPGRTWLYFLLRALGAAALVGLPFAVADGKWWLAVLLLPVMWFAPHLAKGIRKRLVKNLTGKKVGARALEEQGTKWLDLFASSDPVSEGHLDLDGHHSRSVRVTNHRSTLRDHTSYWQNVEEFTSRVAFSLATLSGWPRFDALVAGDRSRARRAIAERQRRTKWLLLGRWSAGLTGILLVGVGRTALTLPDSMAAYAHDVPWLSQDFATTLETQLHEPSVRGWLGAALAVTVLAAFHWTVTVRVWNGWDRAAKESLVSRKPTRALPQLLTYLVIAFPPVAAAALLVVVGGLAAETPQMVVGGLALIAIVAVAQQAIARRWAEPVPVESEQQFGEATTSAAEIAAPRSIGRRLDSDRAAPVVAHSCLWTSSGQAVVRVPLDGGPETTIPVGGTTLAMAADQAGIWVTTDEAEILHVPADGVGPVRRPISLSAPCPALAASNGHLWTIDSETRRVLGFTKDGEEAGRSHRLGMPTALAVGHGRLWVADKTVHGVLSLDPADPSRPGRQIPIGLTPASMQCTPSGVWMWFRPGLVGLLPSDGQAHKLGSVFKAVAKSPSNRGDEWVVPSNGTTWVLRGRDGRWFTVNGELELVATRTCLPAPVTGVTHLGEKIYVTTRSRTE